MKKKYNTPSLSDNLFELDEEMVLCASDGVGASAEDLSTSEEDWNIF